MEPSTSPPSRRQLFHIFLVTFRIGLFTFGGGAAMLPMIQREFVEKQGWINEEDIADIFAVAQSLPGAMSVNASVLLGHRIASTAGGLLAGLGCILPSFLVIIGVSLCYNLFITNPYVAGALRGIRGAVLALLLSAIWKLRKNALKDIFQWILALAALGVSLFLPWINAIFIILACGLLGILYYHRRLKQEGDETTDA
ncbi:MAG: chromate transporter [Oscillospiraceae bacterium]|nr:chromate transporter [Oscillospiraceae bacterium]